MTLRHQLDSLVVYDPDRSTSTVNVWVAHPSASEEHALGTLFVVSAIDDPAKINHEVLSLLQEELKRQYYQANDQRVESAFESALQRTNQRLHDLIREGVAGWVNHAHILAGVLWREHLILTSLGTVHAFLVRHDRLHELLGTPATSKPNPLRLFDHVIVGQLESNDRILLSTPSLLDYFSMEKIRRTLLDYLPSQAARVLETTLLGVGPRLAFAALLLKLDAAALPSATPTPVVGVNARPAPQLSMDQLVTRERTTEKILAPSVWPTIKDLARNTVQSLQRAIRSLTGRPPKRYIASSHVTASVRTAMPSTPIRPLAGTVGTSVRNLAQRIRHTLANRRSLARPTMALPRIPRPTRFSLSDGFSRIIRWFQNLVPTQRRVVTILIIVVMVFSTAIVRSNSNGAPTGSPAQSEASVSAIEGLFAQAEAALLFGGDDLARQHLGQAEQRIGALSDRRRSERELRDRLTRELTTLRNRVRRITTVANPEVVVSLAPAFPNVRPAQLYIAGDRYLVFEPESGTLISGPLDDSAEPTASQNTLDTGAPRTGALIGLTRVVFGTDRGTMVEYSLTDNDWAPLDSRFPNQQTFIQSLSAFQSRLYALDTAHDQIYRFSLASTSLGSGQAWLRETVDLSKSRAAVVDGSIWVLQPGGEVIEFFGGRRTDFQLPEVDPQLTNPTRLWTNEASQNLYLLEPDTQRIVVLDKDGRLVSQYQSGSWTNLRDVVADEGGGQIYVLSGTNLYRVPIE